MASHAAIQLSREVPLSASCHATPLSVCSRLQSTCHARGARAERTEDERRTMAGWPCEGGARPLDCVSRAWIAQAAIARAMGGGG